MDIGAHENTIGKIKTAIEQGLSFDQACSALNIEDTGLRASIVNDSLKVLVADMHFSKGMPLKQLAMKLRLPLSRIINTKESMGKEAEETGSHSSA
jgi:hypothetical protein